jgi:hypothetical protein
MEEMEFVEARPTDFYHEEMKFRKARPMDFLPWRKWSSWRLVQGISTMKK